MPQDLFPPIEPFRSGHMDVGDGHSIYWEVSGRSGGAPVVFLHGGPGAGASPDHRRFFDPAHYQIVVFDQRGAGRSRPLGEIAANNTDLLIEDMERLRRLLEIERWLVFGGSWGSTLGLAYGQRHPERTVGLILRGIFLGTVAEIDWFLHGIRRFFPEHWRRFAEFLPPEERNDLLQGYLRRLNDPDPALHMPAARAWSRYEGSCATLLPSPATVAAFSQDRLALGLARIEAHYFAKKMFLPDNALLDNIDKLRGIPGTIVHGRYDMVCPVETADRLKQAWPEAGYQIVPDAGHSAMESGIRQALVAATERAKPLT